MDTRSNPVHGVGEQTHAPRRVKALYGLHQTDISFLDEIFLRQPVARVAPGQVHDITQVGGNQSVSSINIVVCLIPLREISLFVFIETRKSSRPGTGIVESCLLVTEGTITLLDIVRFSIRLFSVFSKLIPLVAGRSPMRQRLFTHLYGDVGSSFSRAASAAFAQFPTARSQGRNHDSSHRNRVVGTGPGREPSRPGARAIGSPGTAACLPRKMFRANRWTGSLQRLGEPAYGLNSLPVHGNDDVAVPEGRSARRGCPGRLVRPARPAPRRNCGCPRSQIPKLGTSELGQGLSTGPGTWPAPCRISASMERRLPSRSHRHFNLLTDLHQTDPIAQGRRSRNGLAVHFDDHIASSEPGFLGGRVWLNLRHHRTFDRIEIQRLSEVRRLRP